MNYFEYMPNRARPCAIVAHRGVWRAAPENSLLAIEQVIATKCDVVEIDVRSADGELVLLHDDTLTRMTGVDAWPEHLTVQELTRLRLRNRDGGESNPPTDEFLPRLKDIFALTRDRIFVHVDVKHRDVIPDVIACAKEMQVDKQVDFWADLKTEADLDWVRREIVSRGVPLIARVRLGEADAERQLELAFELKPFVCELSFRDLAQVAAVRDRLENDGATLWVNTLDPVASPGFTDTAALRDPDAVWGQLMDAGFSAIQTDETEALRVFIDGRAADAEEHRCSPALRPPDPQAGAK
ncbi:glycerophosphodiester phosphodiesterase family protein [Chelatococcus sp. GCM10030263]|uniref:glycerophosphodiester phosphodiesterase family protein n=1 Tax=Chelatococcus sp. GCM10030263 TaxID=3273387 RepID=UPI00361B9417